MHSGAHKCDLQFAGRSLTERRDLRLDPNFPPTERCSVDETQRTRLGAALTSTVTQVTGIWVYDRGRIDAYRTRLHGIKSNGWDQVTWNVAEWWLAGN